MGGVPRHSAQRFVIEVAGTGGPALDLEFLGAPSLMILKGGALGLFFLVFQMLLNPVRSA
jgi:hypothetical protein